jgi:cysteine desulfurase
MQRKQIYLDWASSAPVSKAAQRAFMGTMDSFGNPSSPHDEGVRAHHILEDSRKKIARLSGVKTEGVIFTSGATEANNIAIHGTVSAREGEEAPHVLYLPTAHASVVETAQALRMGGAEVEELIIKEGAVDLDAFKGQLRPETVLVSMDVVCGETGTRFATRDVRRTLDAYATENKTDRIILHLDASQAPFVESIDCNHLGADLLTLDAQKVGGVRGIGALIRKNALIPLKPIMQGGGQQQGIRPGTESPALAAAFAVALQEAEEARMKFIIRAMVARTVFLATLSYVFPDMTVNKGKEFAPNIINISFPKRDTDYAVMLLSKAGFAVSTKSACETDAVGSRVVLTLTGDESRALSTLRISWGPSSRTKDLKKLSKKLIETIKFLDAHAL